jgi:hypothetical protein
VNLTPKIRNTLDLTTRIAIAALALSYIFYRFYTLPSEQVSVFIGSVFKSDHFIGFLALLFLLMVFNWSIEALKWRILINQVEIISIPTAFQAVIGGLAASIFTPNRVGEFIGRVFILKKTEPIKAVFLTIVGSFSQLLVTIGFGTIAFVLVVTRYLSQPIYMSAGIVNVFSAVLVIFTIVLVILYFNISVLRRIPFLLQAKYTTIASSVFKVLSSCSKPLLLKVVLLSALRYLVFSVQFLLCIRLMAPGFTVWQCMMIIPLIYLALAAIPTIALTELGVRGSVSVFLFGLLAVNNSLDTVTALEVVSASTLIWIINIAFPSLAGVLVIFRLKFFRQ